MKELIGYFKSFSVQNEFGVAQIHLGENVQDRAMAKIVVYQIGNAIMVATCNGYDETLLLISNTYTIKVGDLYKMAKGIK